jgi:hypothetical protein
MRIPRRWLVAVAAGGVGAVLLFAATGHWSVVLLLGPTAFILGDVVAARHKARLQARVDAAFIQLVSDDDSGFRGADAIVLRQRARLLGFPPRLVDIRMVRMPHGSHFAVRAETRDGAPDRIDWRVTRLAETEAQVTVP